MTKPLSPTAAAVLDAFLNGYICNPEFNVAFESDRNGLAAALRAAAGQLDHSISQHRLFAIAAELEGQ